MPRVAPPSPLPSNPLLEALSKGLRDFTGPENPPVHLPLKAASEAASYMTGPDNPPVNILAQILRRGDPHGLMTMGNPLSMALKRYDAWGKAIPVAAETGAPLAKTAKDFAQESAGHQAATIAARKAEATAGGIQSVAFRNKLTGEVIQGGHFHPSSFDRLPDSWKNNPLSNSTIEYGYMDADGKFLTRQEAAKRAPGVGTMPQRGEQFTESYGFLNDGGYGDIGDWGMEGRVTSGKPRLARTLEGILDEIDIQNWKSHIEEGKPLRTTAEIRKEVEEKIKNGWWHR